MTLTLGFSTCPNDTFIFDALVHNKIDTLGLNFEVSLGDVEELNKVALQGKADITKLSFHAYAHVADKYLLLDSGSALGRNNGPLLISKRKTSPDELGKMRIGIPGVNTTANLLLNILFPNVKNKKEYLFSDIEAALLNDEIDAGLIIHENRFTYAKRGFTKIADLGEEWEKQTNSHIPLGAIVVNRKLPKVIQQKVNLLIRKSIEYAYKNPDSSLAYIRQFAQEMEDNVMHKHIELYVNEFSVDLGVEGKKAINILFDEAKKRKLIPKLPELIFVT